MKSKTPPGPRLARAIVFLLSLSLAALDTSGACRTPQWTTVNVVSGYQFDRLWVLDMNGDRHLDIAGMYWWVLLSKLGTGAATFTSGPYTQIPSASDPTKFTDAAFGDLNGDGKLDAVIADYGTGRLLVYPNTASGSAYTTAVITTTQLLPHIVVTGDFNGDGKGDVVYASWEVSSVVFMAGDGSGAFTESSRTTVPSAEIVALISGDFDHDGRLDLAMTHDLSTTIDVLFGRGDGTFEPAVQATAGVYPNGALAMVDVDSDGHDDLIAANWGDQSVTVNLNLGGRAFTAPQTYVVKMPGSLFQGNSTDVTVGDFSGDGIADIATIHNGSQIAILNGRGDGSFDAATFSQVQQYLYTKHLAAGDFNEDGKIDLLLDDRGHSAVMIAVNHCGEPGSMTAQTVTPMINVAQHAVIKAEVKGIGSYPAATGSVDFLENGAVLASASLSAGIANGDIAGLAAGDHTITAHYGGDENYSPLNATVIQKVTTATTTVTLTFPQSPQYRQSVLATASVTSSSGGTPTGTIAFSIDGAPHSVAWLPSTGTTIDITSVSGPHVLRADYSGDATHPPGSGQTVYTSVKASVTISFVNLPPVSYAGTGLTFGVSAGTGGYTQSVPGTVQVSVDGSPVATVPAVSSYPFPSVTVSLAVGLHFISAAYAGDSQLESARVDSLPFRILPTTVPFEARADDSGLVICFWKPVPGAVNYIVSRRSLMWSSWAMIAYQQNSPCSDLYASTKNVAYYYKIEAVDGKGNVIATAFDTAMQPDFAESPLPGSIIKASHFAVIAARANIIRGLAGLAAQPLPPAIAAGQVIDAASIQKIRDGLDEARSKLGAPPLTYGSDAFLSGVPVRASDVMMLQEGTR